MTTLFETKPARKVSAKDVLKALRNTRIKEAGLQESEIRDRLYAELIKAGMTARTEVPFGPGCRADIWVDGVVVEVKKKRPDRAKVTTQLHRYAQQKNVTGMILVLERSIVLPEEIDNKPVAILSLNSLWGIAL